VWNEKIQHTKYHKYEKSGYDRKKEPIKEINTKEEDRT
jgi:hypothetical protein